MSNSTAAKRALDPREHYEVGTEPEPTAVGEEVSSYSEPVSPGRAIPVSSSAGVVVRFVGLVGLALTAVGSLIFAISQNSFRGIVLTSFLCIASAVCFVFALQDLLDTKTMRVPHSTERIVH